MTTLGGDALEIHDGFKYEQNESRHDIDTVIAKFDSYFISETNETYESDTFNKCDQLETENIETYVTQLRQLV